MYARQTHWNEVNTDTYFPRRNANRWDKYLQLFAEVYPTDTDCEVNHEISPLDNLP